MPPRSSSLENPRAALLTPRGRGAVATIRLDGDCRLIDDAAGLFAAANGRPLCDQPPSRIVFGHWGNEVREAVVVCRTGTRTLEIHCHGGDAAAERILQDLSALGCAVLPWTELMTTSAGLFETECLETLSRATTERTAIILHEQRSGILRRALEALLNRAFSADSAPHSASLAPQPQRQQLMGRIDAMLAWAEFGLHLTRPWRVVVAGRPNVGKSSLINALVGYSRSIVYDQPGTTRDVVTVETALEGWPIRLADTAGIRAGIEPLESAGIARAERVLCDADCRLLLFDVSRPATQDDFRLLADWPDSILVAHKCDLPDVSGSGLPVGAQRVSSSTGAGIDDLAAALVARLVPNVPPPETPIPVTLRQVELLTAARSAFEEGDQRLYSRLMQELLT